MDIVGIHSDNEQSRGLRASNFCNAFVMLEKELCNGHYKPLPPIVIPDKHPRLALISLPATHTQQHIVCVKCTSIRTSSSISTEILADLRIPHFEMDPSQISVAGGRVNVSLKCSACSGCAWNRQQVAWFAEQVARAMYTGTSSSSYAPLSSGGSQPPAKSVRFAITSPSFTSHVSVSPPPPLSLAHPDLTLFRPRS